MKKTFRKTLSANDIGSNGSHQAGVLIPKSEKDLLAMLPKLDPNTKNPDSWIECIDETEKHFRFRFVYYNNKFHDENGTRDEYRLTHMTAYLRNSKAEVGDLFEISKSENQDSFSIGIIRSQSTLLGKQDLPTNRIKLKGWRQIH